MNYLQFSKIAAAAMRKALKPEVKARQEALAKGEMIKTSWVDGKPVGNQL